MLHACGTEADLPDYVIEVAVAVVSLAGLCFWVCLSGGGNPSASWYHLFQETLLIKEGLLRLGSETRVKI